MNKLYNSEDNIVYWDNIKKIPEFKQMMETKQNKLWHKEGNVYEHTKLVTKHMLQYIANNSKSKFLDLSYRTILILSALLHDIGKIKTTKKEEDGLYHCKDHANKGVTLAESVLNKYVQELKDYEKEAILSLIKNHMQPLYILNAKNPNTKILNVANNLSCIDFESLLLLKFCDSKGAINNQNINNEKIIEDVRKLFYEVCSYPANSIVQIEKIQTLKNTNSLINVGFKTDGRLYFPVTVGFITIVGSFHTSSVTRIIDKNHFETKNSIYKINII